MIDSKYYGIYQYPQIVQDYWKNEPNFLVEYNECCSSKEYCAIYFCRNDIWFPHTEEIFRKRIVEKNFFEWYHCRIIKLIKIYLCEMFLSSGILRVSMDKLIHNKNYWNS